MMAKALIQTLLIIAALLAIPFIIARAIGEAMGEKR